MNKILLPGNESVSSNFFGSKVRLHIIERDRGGGDGVSLYYGMIADTRTYEFFRRSTI